VDGTIQRFEFTFELFWKALRRFLQREGIDTGSPRSTLRHTYRRGLLDHEQLWLDMLDDRNAARTSTMPRWLARSSADYPPIIVSCGTASSTWSAKPARIDTQTRFHDGWDWTSTRSPTLTEWI
jgi:hypothetical protein